MPTIGVYSGNDLAWENMDDNFIDLQYEDTLAELEASGADQDEIADALDFFEGGDTLLYGGWLESLDGMYEPDPTGEYAMIFNANENTAQVVFSKTVKFGRLASPCYPGQVDARVDDPSKPKKLIWDDYGPITPIYLTIAYYALPVGALRGDE